jgi:hypothetical protein
MGFSWLRRLVCGKLLASKYNAQVFSFQLFRAESSGVSRQQSRVGLVAQPFGCQDIVIASLGEG